MPNSRQSTEDPSRNRPQEQNVPLKCQIYISSIPLLYTEDDLRRLFRNYDVRYFRMLKKETHRYAFMYLSSPEEAVNAVKEMNHYKLEGSKELIVSLATSSPGNGTPALYKAKTQSYQQSVTSSHEVTNGKRNDRVNQQSECGSIHNEEQGGYDDMPPLELIDEGSQFTYMNGEQSSPQCNGESEIGNEQCVASKIMISNFPAGTSEFQIMDIFREYNPLKCLILVPAPILLLNEETLALVYFSDEHDAKIAKREVDGLDFQNKTLIVWNLI